MAEYIYLPVPSDEMKSMARDMQAVRARKQLAVPQLLHNAHIAGHRKGFEHLFNGCLKRVSGTDIVYLLMHGAGRADSDTISAARTLKNGVEDKKRYTPEEIAHTIEKEGLTKSFVDLKLLCCGAGLSGNKTSIAERVFDALKKRGYNRIQVTGYLGNSRVGCGSQGYKIDRQMGRGEWERVKANQAEVIFN